MKRWLFNLAAAVSMVLCVATVTLWVRSYWYWDSIGRYPYRPDRQTYHQQTFNSSLGTFSVHWYQEKYLDLKSAAEMARRRAAGIYGETWRFSRDPLSGARKRGRGVWEWLGFQFIWTRDQKNPDGNLVSALFVGVPDWLLIAVLASTPVVWTVRRVRDRRRTVLGFCPTCGYDLRATPDRCPECGTVPPAQPADTT